MSEVADNFRHIVPQAITMKPRSKSESWFKTYLWELDYICHSRQFRKWVKRGLSRARRRNGKLTNNHGRTTAPHRRPN